MSTAPAVLVSRAQTSPTEALGSTAVGAAVPCTASRSICLFAILDQPVALDASRLTSCDCGKPTSAPWDFWCWNAAPAWLCKFHAAQPRLCWLDLRICELQTPVSSQRGKLCFGDSQRRITWQKACRCWSLDHLLDRLGGLCKPVHHSPVLQQQLLCLHLYFLCSTGKVQFFQLRGCLWLPFWTACLDTLRQPNWAECWGHQVATFQQSLTWPRQLKPTLFHRNYVHWILHASTAPSPTPQQCIQYSTWWTISVWSQVLASKGSKEWNQHSHKEHNMDGGKRRLQAHTRWHLRSPRQWLTNVPVWDFRIPIPLLSL